MVAFLAGFAKGVFDGINEDAAAKRQLEYDKQLAELNEDPPIDYTQTLFTHGPTSNFAGLPQTFQMADKEMYKTSTEVSNENIKSF